MMIKRVDVLMEGRYEVGLYRELHGYTVLTHQLAGKDGLVEKETNLFFPSKYSFIEYVKRLVSIAKEEYGKDALKEIMEVVIDG